MIRIDGAPPCITDTFPDMPLAEARQLRDEARRDLRDKVDPAAVKRQAAAEAAMDGITFETMARAWHVHQRPRWTAVHAGEVLVGLERDVFPAIGDKSLAAIDAPMVLDVLRTVERRGCLETARRLRQRISAVFVLAMSEGNPVRRPSRSAWLAGDLLNGPQRTVPDPTRADRPGAGPRREGQGGGGVQPRGAARATANTFSGVGRDADGRCSATKRACRPRPRPRREPIIFEPRLPLKEKRP